MEDFDSILTYRSLFFSYLREYNIIISKSFYNLLRPMIIYLNSVSLSFKKFITDIMEFLFKNACIFQ